MRSKRRIVQVETLVAAFGALVLATFSACGPPPYPQCDNDEHCQREDDQLSVCVDGECRECRSDEQCTSRDPCLQCNADNACESRFRDCCTNDTDCPQGRCWKDERDETVAGTELGQCGPRCKKDEHCPEGQMCKDGRCVPEAECTTDADCASDEECKDGECVKATCEMKNINFDFNEYTIRLDQESIVESNAECLKQRDEPHRIEGHCDERGSDEYNLALGQRRANTVKDAYVDLGVDSDLLSTISYGEERPLCTRSNEECWSRNRRAETVRKD